MHKGLFLRLRVILAGALLGHHSRAEGSSLIACKNALARVLAHPSLATDNPSALPVGAVTVHKYTDPRVVPSNIVLSQWTPMARPQSADYILNLNSLKAGNSLPDRFVMSDGSLNRVFILVDRRPGSPLEDWIKPAANEVRKAVPDLNPKKVADYLAVNVSKKWVRGIDTRASNNGLADLAWDRALPRESGDVQFAMNQAASQNIFDMPIAAGISHQVIPLEAYFEARRGYCLQQALFTSLVLDDLGIAHRFVNGAVSFGPGSTGGHAWVEMANGMILDSSWERFGPAKHDVPGFSDWFSFQGSLMRAPRFEYATYPVVVLKN